MVSNKLTVLSAAFMPIALSVSLYASDPIAVEPAGWWNKPDDELRTKILDGTSYLSMKMAMKTAPELVTDAIEHLKDPKAYNRPEWRFMWLYGPSGTGKSTLAKAIAAYTGWDLIVTRPSDFQTKGRGEAAKALDAFIDKIVASEAETVVVFEEGNGLMDNHEDNRYDSAETCRAFWTKVDGLKGKNKIFLPITANIIQNVPKQIKTRSKMRGCKVDQPTDLASRVSIAMDVMKADGLPRYISERALKTSLEIVLPKAPEWRCRDFQEFCFDLTRKSTNLYNKLLKEKLKNLQKVSEAQLLQAAQNVEDNFNKELPNLISKSFIDCLAAENEWDYDKIALTNIDRENIAAVQNIALQAIKAQIDSEVKIPIIQDFLEAVGLREPAFKTIGRLMTAEQHKTIKDGKMPLANLDK